MWIIFPGINPYDKMKKLPNKVPKKKYLNGRPTIGPDTLIETLGINGVNLKNSI